MTGKKISIEDAQRFILAGISTFTLHNSKTGNSFKYNVKISDDGKLYFASVIINSEKSYLSGSNLTHKQKLLKFYPCLFVWLYVSCVKTLAIGETSSF